MDYGNLKVPENVTPEVQAILDSYEARNKEIEKNHLKNMGRIGLGTAISSIGILPFAITKNPIAASGLGGALYEFGQGLVEGDKTPELLARTGIGATVGAVAGKALPAFAKSKAGQAIGNQASKLYNSFADTKLGQKVSEIAPKVEDLLMTDIKAFNPFKQTQTAYHGSPADFNKFSNEAIGSGEGNQVHGYGHYVAKNKNIADERYRKRLSSGDYEIAGEKLDDPFQEATLRDVMAKGKSNVIAKYEKDLLESKKIIDDFESKYTKNELFQNDDLYLPYDNARDRYMNTLERYDFIKNIDENSITKNEGQLFKVAIPQEDMFLRENALYKEQSPYIQENLKKMYEENYKKYPHNSNLMQILYTDNMAQKNKGNLAYREGKNIYDAISEMTGSPQEASKLLDKYGIKGISYFGDIDKEARVIFNPDNIEIIKKYYNQPKLWDKLKGLRPNEGAELAAIENALRNPQFPMNEQDFNAYEDLGLRYYQNIFQPNTIEIPGYGVASFSRKNRGKDDVTNFRMYPDLFELLTGAKPVNRTNYKNELDRQYDYLENPNNKIYQFLMEDIKDKGKRYKMMRNKETGK